MNTLQKLVVSFCQWKMCRALMAFERWESLRDEAANPHRAQNGQEPSSHLT